MAEDDQLGTSLAAQGENDETPAGESPEGAGSSGEGLKFEGFDDKDRTTLSRFKNVGDLGKSYLELLKRQSASVPLPGPNATPEQREAFYEKLGRPKSPDEYKFDRIALPDGVKQADFGEAEYRKAAHRIGLTQDQAQELLKWSVDQSVALLRENKRLFEERKRASAEALQRQHGDSYREKLARMDKLNRKFGGDEWIGYLNRGAGNDPELLRFLITMADSISEDALEAGRPITPKHEPKPGVISYDNRPGLRTG